jgi:type IV fimbrial biogenesis protein FimT
VLNGSDDHGFTLIELMITLAVLAILLVLAMPSFSKTVSNAKVRSVAETLLNGLRSAQAAAIQQSHQAAFVLTNATPVQDAPPASPGVNWYAQILPVYGSESAANFYLQGGSLGNQTSGSTVTGPSVICFNSIGRITSNTNTGAIGVACAANDAQYDITHPSADRTLRVLVSVSGKIRLCDPARALTASTPDGCP